jgi:hypothetical protein
MGNGYRLLKNENDKNSKNEKLKNEKFEKNEISSKYSKTLICLNCSSSSPTLRLARFLEGALCRALTSRLAVPFTRPLLPLSKEPSIQNPKEHSCENSFKEHSKDIKEHSIDDNENENDYKNDNDSDNSNNNNDNDNHNDKNNNNHNKDYNNHDNDDVSNNHHNNGDKIDNNSICLTEVVAPLDLLGVLEKVRDLQYSSTTEFFIDLNSIKKNLHKFINFEIENKINLHLNGQINGDLSTCQNSPLLHSFNTIIDSCEMFLRARSVAIQLAQEGIVKIKGKKPVIGTENLAVENVKILVDVNDIIHNNSNSDIRNPDVRNPDIRNSGASSSSSRNNGNNSVNSDRNGIDYNGNGERDNDGNNEYIYIYMYVCI